MLSGFIGLDLNSKSIELWQFGGFLLSFWGPGSNCLELGPLTGDMGIYRIWGLGFMSLRTYI